MDDITLISDGVSRESGQGSSGSKVMYSTTELFVQTFAQSCLYSFRGIPLRVEMPYSVHTCVRVCVYLNAIHEYMLQGFYYCN